MSGGVGSTANDLSLPKEKTNKQNHYHSSVVQEASHKKGFLSLRQLNCLAVILVLSASGMVSMEDFTFVFFSIFYMYFISKVAFPNLTSTIEPPVFEKYKKFLGMYVLFAAIIGLFLPIAYIFEGIYEGDKESIKAAAPHVFLLASQVFMEGLAFSGGFSLPIRVFVPVCYNAKRIFRLLEWLQSEISKGEELHRRSIRRLYIGRGLAVANFAFWCFNLFGFLVPVYLPRAFKQYYTTGYKLKD